MGFEPTLASVILIQAHRLLDQGNLRYALIEGVSAVELALSEFMRKKLLASSSLREFTSEFENLSFKAKVITVATALGKIPMQDIENIIKAYNMRNKIVHEGWSPADSELTEVVRNLFSLLRTTALLLGGPRFKFLSANTGNTLRNPEQWEQEDK